MQHLSSCSVGSMRLHPSVYTKILLTLYIRAEREGSLPPLAHRGSSTVGEGHQEHHRGPGTMCLQHWSWGQLLKGKILLQEIEGQKVNTKTFIKSTPLQPSLCLNKYSKTTYCPNSFYLSFQKCYFFESRFIKNPRRQRSPCWMF